MLRRHVVLAVITVILASFFVWAGAAAAHEGEIVSADCSSVSGAFVKFAPGDHPISFAVSIGGAPFQTVASVESPPGFVGSGTATADIASLTETLEGKTASLDVYAFWPAGRTDTAAFSVTCGTSPPPTTTPPPPTTTPPPPTTTTPPPPPTTTTPPPPPTAPPAPTASAEIAVKVAVQAPPAVPMVVQPATAG